MNSAINVNLKNDKQSPMSSKPIHSEKMQAPVDFAIKRSAKTYVSCGLLTKGNTCYIMLLLSVSALWSSCGQISLSVTTLCLHLHLLSLE